MLATAIFDLIALVYFQISIYTDKNLRKCQKGPPIIPGFITHYLGGQSALLSVSPVIHDCIAPMSCLYNLGTQGPDIFFYYVPGFVTKRIRGIGTQMHNENLGLFITQMANVLMQTEGDTRRQAIFAYTAGFLAHYAMDVHTHPYVFAQTQNPATSVIKEATRHRHFETSIDVLMLSRLYNKKPLGYKQWQLISTEKPHKKIAAAAAGESIRKVYGRNISTNDVYRAMGQMASFTRFLQSKTGRRKRWLGRVESITIGSKIISALIHMQNVTDGCDYLNINKTPWAAPWAPEIVRTESFPELFESAVKDTVQMIEALYAYMQNGLSQSQLAAQIRNRSLKTGLAIQNANTGAPHQPGQSQ